MRACGRHIVKRDLMRIGQIRNIHNMYVSRRCRANRARAFLADKREALRAVRVVTEPPHVVHLASDRLHIAEQFWIRDGAACTTTADVEDRHTVVPQCDHENPVTNEYVVHEWISHLLRKNLK